MKNIIYITIFSTFLALSACSVEEKTISDNETAIEVTTSKIIKNTNQEGVYSASGKLVAKNSTQISTRMMGYITQLNVKVGQKVSKGQLLVRINNSDLKAKEGQIKAQISQAQANYNIAEKDYNRFKNLYENQSASQKELDDMTARFEMAKAGLDAAKEMQREIRTQYQYTNITAPISGMVTQKYANQGDMANPGMPLLTIESHSSIQAQTLVPESYITQIEKGMQVNVILKSLNEIKSGKVVEVSRSAVNTGGQYVVKVDLENDKSILPGMYVNVQFPVEATSNSEENIQSIMIPESALVKKGQLTGVYAVSHSGTAILRWVETGQKSGEQIEILSGLNNDESYIVSAKGKLYNGVKVNIN